MEPSRPRTSFSRLFCALCAFSRRRFFLFSIFCFLLFGGALFWAHARDPFARRWFTVRPPGQPKAQCVAILPKNVTEGRELQGAGYRFQVEPTNPLEPIRSNSAAGLSSQTETQRNQATAVQPVTCNLHPAPPGARPVVIYCPNSGGTLLGSGNEMRQMAEMGLAVVGMESCQTNDAAAQAQLSTLIRYIERQPWADTNRIVKVVAQSDRLHVDLLDDAPRSTLHAPPRSTFPAPAPATFPLQPAERLATFRRVGEYCLVQLNGPEALARYQSILEWQARAWPLWLYWTPAFAWAAFLSVGWRVRSAECDPETKGDEHRVGDLQSEPLPTPSRSPLPAPNAPRSPRWLTCTAVLLAAVAGAVTAIHLVAPRLHVSGGTLTIARRFLVPEKERADFEYLAGQGNWESEKLGTLLEHVQLANYNRELVNWKVDQDIYRRYALWPEIQEESPLNRRDAKDAEERKSETAKSAGAWSVEREATQTEKLETDKFADRKVTAGNVSVSQSFCPTNLVKSKSKIINQNWRRVLWESFYPRIRKEQSPEAAAEIVARYLRERMTVTQKSRNQKVESRNEPECQECIGAMWRRQITDEEGFETLYVAALRSVGIGARLDGTGKAELWTGEKWNPMPQSLISSFASLRAGYAGATWVGPVATGNFETGRSNSSIGYIVLHTAELSMAAALSKFQTSGRKISSHYLVGTNGTIWQAVGDADTAYHCGNLAWNRQSIGVELEGWGNGNPAGNFSWQTAAQRTAVESLLEWLHVQYGVPLDRDHILGHNQVPSPGGSYPPSTNWGGGNSHWDPGAWFDWRRILTDLGHVTVFTPVAVQTATSILTLPSSDAPIITPAVAGQKFVAYDLYNGYYLVFVTGQELAQKSLGSGEYHWDGWIPASSVSVESNALQLEVTNAFPHLCPIYDRPSFSAPVLAHTTDGKRYIATGRTASADGCVWCEFYIARTGGTNATAWAVADAFIAVGNPTHTLSLDALPPTGAW